MRFKDKVALVTGGNSEIGRGIVRRFVKEGARVTLTTKTRQGRRYPGGDEGLGRRCEIWTIDVGVEADVCAMVEAVVKRFGRLDVVVNNAGGGSRKAGVLPDHPPGTRLHKVVGLEI